MGFDLMSESGEEFQFNNSGWRYLMEFAEAHGFRWPVESSGEEKDALSADESSALADAIERGIGDGSSFEIAARVSDELTKRLVTPTDSPLFRNDPLKFDARTIDYWNEFVRFARRGGFSMTF